LNRVQEGSKRGTVDVKILLDVRQTNLRETYLDPNIC
jgi:hypothetical protein